MNKKEKEEQESLAMLQFSRDEVKVITGNEIDEESFLRGTLKAQAEVRQSILQMAKQGSSPAQKQFLDFVKTPERIGDGKEVKEAREWGNKTDELAQQMVAVTIEWLFHGGQHPSDFLSDAD